MLRMLTAGVFHSIVAVLSMHGKVSDVVATGCRLLKTSCYPEPPAPMPCSRDRSTFPSTFLAMDHSTMLSDEGKRGRGRGGHGNHSQQLPTDSENLLNLTQTGCPLRPLCKALLQGGPRKGGRWSPQRVLRIPTDLRGCYCGHRGRSLSHSHTSCLLGHGSSVAYVLHTAGA
jgi:hypothetical protein